jgi:hypothetical protein
MARAITFFCLIWAGLSAALIWSKHAERRDILLVLKQVAFAAFCAACTVALLLVLVYLF